MIFDMLSGNIFLLDLIGSAVFFVIQLGTLGTYSV